MTTCPEELLYSKTHEWIRINDDEVTVGVTDHAQHLLGELVFVELPELHRHVEDGDEVAVLESVKTAADVYAPLTGDVIAVNTELQSDPSQVNQDPYGNGWLFKIKLSPEQQFNHMLDAAGYQDMISAESTSHD